MTDPTDHTEAVRVGAEALKRCDWWIDAVPDDYAEREARVVIEAYLAATVQPDCPTCRGESYIPGYGVCDFCTNGKLPSRYLVVVDAERDGKLALLTWASTGKPVRTPEPLFREVPPEEG